ncbi:MAG: dihydrolipoamide acyltransferase [Candidatus Cloacimonetes bacterium HGW-Cloacimonetes-3]|jgi:pyruvate dehydrogenase E2 component (dihydrolipoamide acetyltransferase)|nr:MAG: dihydrolipoamide acyltransferase [Candidatus Cloacimonetes bacterium HGW-Cloacimonetes-3]
MRYIFKFPDIGEGLEEGKITEWYVEKGQSISAGDALLNMETDKVVTDIPSPKSGIIAQRYGAVGDTVKVGNALVEIEIEGESFEQADELPQATGKGEEVIEEKGFGVVGTMEVAGDGAYLPSSNEGLAAVEHKQAHTRKVLATPVARALAKERGIDINTVQGSGPAGRVTSKDIEKHTQIRSTEQAKSSERKTAYPSDQLHESVPISQIRKTIARNMLRSKQNTAHMSVMEEVEVSELVDARHKINERLKDVKISYLPFIIKAIAIALKNHPVLNAELDMEAERIIYKKYYNIGLAMDTDDGLVVPVIRNADKKSLVQLAKEISVFAEKAKTRKLTLDDMRDGTFTITSYGSIGGYFAVPVINYPQSAIFGIGRIADKPVIKDAAVVPGKVMPISMSVDHRIVDGGEVARFLNEVLEMLKEPMLILAYEGGQDEL